MRVLIPISFVATAVFPLTLSSSFAAPTPLPPESALAKELRLSDALAWAMARSPRLLELRQRQQASRWDARQAGRLPDLQFKYEQWSVPLRRPWGLDQAGAIMMGVQQVLPAAGTRSDRANAELAQAKAIGAEGQMSRLDLAVEVKKAFAAYYQAHRQLALHQEHSVLVAKLLDLARVAYQSGVRSQQDVVRLGLETSRVHEMLVHLEPELESARARLNTLMNRPVDAPLGPPGDLALADQGMNTHEAEVEAARPEVTAARANVARSQALVAEAEHNAKRPMVMLGLDYMLMPNDTHSHAYGAMVALGLPWLNPAHRDETRAAEHRLWADQAALESVRLQVRFDVRDAEMRLRSARASFDVLENDVVIEAQRNLDTARSMYAAGQSDASALMDAARLFLEVRIDRVRAQSHVQEALADLHRALAKEPLTATKENVQ